ncbi:unnamed protein product [Polarella glacialis]|uniref:RING-type domain-containing protein n=1 Tax=Polarella glacialis TaxID=89957 RepID=A0A813KJ82_POLGL|nr:unnamed protein product [Polarella glacialis]
MIATTMLPHARLPFQPPRGRRPPNGGWWRLLCTLVVSVVGGLLLQLLWLPAPLAASEWREVADAPADLAGDSRKPNDQEETLGSNQGAEPSGAGRLASLGLLELQEDTVPWKVVKVLVPLSPQVAKWWIDSEQGEFTIKMKPCSTGGEPHVHLQVWAPKPIDLAGKRVDGLHAIVYLPPGTVLEECHMKWVQVSVDVEPLAGLGPLRALHLSCPVSPRRGANGAGIAGRGGFGGFMALAVFTWLLLPWPMLLLPTIIYSAARPAALGAGLCVARLAAYLRRRRRLWRLTVMGRRKVPIDGAFGADEPCCICFGETSQEEAIIALLPCRHALHLQCYRSWVCTDSYPSRDLICPLCRRRVTAVGKLDGS